MSSTVASRPIQFMVDLNRRHGTKFDALPTETKTAASPVDVQDELRVAGECAALALLPDKTILGARNGWVRHRGDLPRAAGAAVIGLTTGLVLDGIELVVQTASALGFVGRAGAKVSGATIPDANMDAFGVDFSKVE